MPAIHDCKSRLCEEPHYANDRHAPDCLCPECHDHDWRQWNVYPECEGCLRDLSQFIHENVDVDACLFPELCDYSPACVEQWKTEVYRA